MNSKKNKLKPASGLDKLRDFYPYFLITLSAILLYHPIWNFEFTNWDDQVYVTGNSMIRGLRLHNLRRIMTEFVMGNYHPLVMLSYAVEYEFVGMNAGVFHATNVVLHTGSAWILYLCFRELDIEKFTAATMSCIFILHPFHVESVAWVTERKDVLYGFFWIFAWYCWIRSKSWDNWYYVSIFLFILSCLSKGMAVTLPAALLITDLWKTGQWKKIQTYKLLPFIFIGLGFGILAVYAQQKGGNVREDNILDFIDQIRIAGWGVWFYLSRSFVPVDLNVYYPYPLLTENGLPLRFTFAFLGTGILLTLAFVFGFRQYAKPMLGLLFFLALLFPVSQIIPVGNAMAADRYHYLPSIGLLLSLAWFFDNLIILSNKKSLIGLWVWIAILTLLARERVLIWRNGETLWKATIEQTPELMFAYKNLAKYYENIGQTEAAEKTYRLALSRNAEYAPAWNELGVILKNKGQTNLAFLYFKKSLEIDSINKEAWLNIGTYHDRRGEVEQARIAYGKSLALDSGYAEVWNNYANSLSRTQSFDSANIFFKKAIEIHPGYTEAYNNRGTNFAMQGIYDSARICFLQALEINPNYPEPAFNLGMVYIQENQKDEAIKWLRQAATGGHIRARELLNKMEL